MALSSKSFFFFHSPKTPIPTTKPQIHNQLTFPLTYSPNKTTNLQTKHQQLLTIPSTKTNKDYFHDFEFWHLAHEFQHPNEFKREFLSSKETKNKDPFQFSSSSCCHKKYFHDLEFWHPNEFKRLSREFPSSKETKNRYPFHFSSSSCCYYNSNHDEIVSVAFPSVAYSNTLFFKSAYNLQIIVGDHEPEEKLVSRFRSAVLKAGILQECKRRRFFETTQEKVKRKAREASKRYRKRRPQPKASKEDKKEGPKGYHYESGDDNWEFYDVELRYC